LKYFFSLSYDFATALRIKMTELALLPNEILSIIFGLLSIAKDLIAFKETATVFNLASNMMKIKIAHMTDKTITYMTQFRFTNRVNARSPIRIRMLDKSNKVRDIKNINCANHNCVMYEPENMPYTAIHRNGGSQTPALGLTTFYWPKELWSAHDYLHDPYGPNYEASYRIRQCEDGPSISRIVPYCELCMNKYMNFGTREDWLDVPCANMNGFINA
jgi:hypothetical protein